MKKRALALLGIMSLSLLIVNPLTAYAESYQKIYVDGLMSRFSTN